MTIQSLQRVLWRIRTKHPNQPIINNNTLHRAIMQECGTDPRTIKNNRKALIKLGWIKTASSHYITITNKDQTGD